MPAKPPDANLLFIWPGLQGPDNDGVLQPVLVWGPTTCVSKQTNPPPDYSTWWIAGFYVDDDCYVGRSMSVNVGDALDLDLALNQNVWTMTMTDINTGERTTHFYDLQGRPQNWAIFSVEPYGQYPIDPVYFGASTIKFAKPRKSGCTLFDIGQNNAITDVELSDDKLSCTFAGLVLRDANP